MKMKRDGIDHDPIVPFETWCDSALHPGPMEVVSYPIPADGADGIDGRATLMVRRVPGDPTTLAEVLLRTVACFAPDRHEWGARPRRYYGDTGTAFVFTDEVTP